MDGQHSDQLVTVLVKAIQAYCSGHVQFATCVEVIGHVHLNIDRSVKVDYVLSEAVVKAVSEGGPSFSSHSYLSQPPSQASECGEGQRAGHSHAGDSAVTQQRENKDQTCVNPSSAQTLSENASHSSAVGIRCSREAPAASDQMMVTVSFDPSGVLPLIKQESIPSAGDDDPPAMEDHGQRVDNFLISCHEKPHLPAPRINSHPTPRYRQESCQSTESYSQPNMQPPPPSSSSSVVLAAASFSQDCPQEPTIYSHTSQPAMTSANTPMMQIQEVHSEALGAVVTCPQQTVQPSPVEPLQESCPSRLQTLPSSPLSQLSSQPSAAYLQGSPHQVSPRMEALTSPQTEVPSASEVQPAAISVNCQTEAGTSFQFGNLCLDVVAVKEEVMEDGQASPGGSYTLESGQEQQELPGFSNMLIESLAHPVDGAQLMVVREGVQERELPFPVMLHAHASLSPSTNPPHVDVGSLAQGSASELVVPCSSMDLSPAASVLLGAEDGSSRQSSVKKASQGFQLGNQCWKLQRRWTAASKTRQKFYKKAAGSGTMSPEKEVFKMLSSTRKIELIHDKSRTASAAAKMTSLASTKARNKGVSRKSATLKTAEAADAKPKRKRGRPKKDSKASAAKGPEHVLKKVPWTVQKKQPRKICIVCRRKGLFPFSCYFCPRCPKQPGYCRIRNCFSSFHAEMGLNYSMPTAAHRARRTSST